MSLITKEKQIILEPKIRPPKLKTLIKSPFSISAISPYKIMVSAEKTRAKMQKYKNSLKLSHFLVRKRSILNLKANLT